MTDARRVPSATYRLQMTPSFRFADAAHLAGYLADLGISHVYTSPLLQAGAGSTHGYDVIDPERVNAELGGEAGFGDLVAELRRRSLQLVVDIVPNHMAVATPGNRWWMDVLQNGRASRYAPYFDVDWAPPESKLTDKILVPVLGDHYGRVLEAGELHVVREPGDPLMPFAVAYYEHRFPLSPRTLAGLVLRVAERVGSEALEFVARALGRLPSSTASSPDRFAERQADAPVILRMLAELTTERAANAFDAEVAALNADPDALDALLAQQSYRLAYWRTSGRELDYRRFFDVDNLVGIRVEDAQVFADIHRLVLDWVRSDQVQGVRVDHIDGLRDPQQYLDRLRDAVGDAYLVVEKILEPGEQLRSTWPVDGTTGYEFAALASGLFVDAGAAPAFTDLLAEVTGDDTPFDDVLLEAKHHVMANVLGSEVNRLTEAFVRVCEGLRRYRDFSRHDLHEALREVLAAFSVYRTYVTDDGEVAPSDRRYIDAALDLAVERRPELDPELFHLLRRILLADPAVDGPAERELRARFQQVSGPVMAKSEEDTTFYRYVRLLALNEVGGDPDRFGVTPAQFHEACTVAQRDWPHTMLTLTTHDTKRTEDVRARLAVLAELPDEWAATVRRWRERNAVHHRGAVPDAVTELYLYQTLVGAHPLPLDRCWTHLEKAIREAKVHTSWVHIDETYEADLRAFVEAIYADDGFQAELAEFVAPLVAPGRINSLAQKLLHLTAPGVPDIYQGQELWDLSLVDPDNRRPVDYDRRHDLLGELQAKGPGCVDVACLADPDDPGLAKLLVVAQALAVRRSHAASFGGAGAHRPLATDTDDGTVVAYERGEDVVVAVPRFTVRHPLTDRSGSLDLPDGSWRHALVDAGPWSGSVDVAELFAAFPVALLVREEA